MEARRGVAGEEGDRGLSEMIETVERGKRGRGSGERWEIREKVNRVTSDRRPGGRREENVECGAGKKREDVESAR